MAYCTPSAVREKTGMKEPMVTLDRDRARSSVTGGAVLVNMKGPIFGIARADPTPVGPVITHRTVRRPRIQIPVVTVGQDGLEVDPAAIGPVGATAGLVPIGLEDVARLGLA